MATPLSLKQILRNLYRHPGGYERIQRAIQVKVTQLKRGVRKSTRSLIFVARTRTPESVGGRVVMVPYTTSIEFFTPKQARISCACPDFWATWEWALAQHKNAEILYGNGDAPDERNPRYTAGCCKHVVAVIDECVRAGYLTADFEVPRP